MDADAHSATSGGSGTRTGSVAGSRWWGPASASTDVVGFWSSFVMGECALDVFRCMDKNHLLSQLIIIN